MIVTINELQDYFKVKLVPEKVKEQLTLKGLEVVDMQLFNPLKPGLKIGEVVKKEKHPAADRLFLTEVKYLSGENNDQEEISPIVCGAKNFEVGAKVVVATPGTVLEGGLKIKKSKIRGVSSQGMICSKAELGLEEKSEGIWVLPEATGLKDDLKKILGEPDYILDVDLTSNRSDCQSVYGMARELASILNEEFIPSVAPLKSYLKNYSEGHSTNSGVKPEVNNSKPNVEVINDSKCQLYLAVNIEGVRVKESPRWLKEKLLRHGFRSINNIVDITNLMLIEYGQPMHAFDQAKVKDRIIVRNAHDKEKFTSLENKDYELSQDDLVIADAGGVIGIAGVIGGLNSEVEDDSKAITLEAAYFSPETVRKTSIAHAINSDASAIFSKKVDHTFTPVLLERAVLYIKELAGGKAGPITEVNNLSPERDEKLPEKVISFNSKEIEKTLALKLSQEEITSYFSRLFFEVEVKDEFQYQVKIPNFRKDINHTWDLVEEIARLYGYDNFPNTLPAIANNRYDIYTSKKDEITGLIKGLGYHEIVTYPFIENSFKEKFDGDGEADEKAYAAPENPLLKNISTLRKDLLYGMLKTININQEKKQVDFNKAFEVGRVFCSNGGEGDEYYEEEMISLAGWDKREVFSWHNNENFDFYNLKGDLEEIFNHLHLPNFSLREVDSNFFSNRLSAEILVDERQDGLVEKKKIGYLGLVKREVADYFHLKNKDVYFLSISLSKINALKLKKVRYKDSIKFPSITRDVNIILPQDKVVGDLLKDIREHSRLLKKVDLMDLYTGDEIGEKKKSIVIRLEFSSNKRTLVKEEADREVEKIIKAIRKKYEFDLR